MWKTDNGIKMLSFSISSRLERCDLMRFQAALLLGEANFQFYIFDPTNDTVAMITSLFATGLTSNPLCIHNKL
jgi:hypothetical protein